jgi:hypothetical protein
MTFRLGNTPVSALRLGNSTVSRLYRGTQLVFDAAPSFTPAALFANGEQGGWYDPSDLSTLFQDRAGTQPVTAPGQSVGRILDRSGNGNHSIAVNDAVRGTYQSSGGMHWIEMDGVDDLMPLGPNLPAGRVTFSLAFKLSLAAFVLAHRSGTIFGGVGQSGSTSTQLSGGVSSRVEYWDGVLSTNTTRGQNYTTGQASCVWEMSGGTEGQWRFGALSGFPGPQRVYQAVVRVGDFSALERANWTTFAAAKAGVAL